MRNFVTPFARLAATGALTAVRRPKGGAATARGEIAQLLAFKFTLERLESAMVFLGGCRNLEMQILQAI